jgi:hypothetical protein
LKSGKLLDQGEHNFNLWEFIEIMREFWDGKIGEMCLVKKEGQGRGVGNHAVGA